MAAAGPSQCIPTRRYSSWAPTRAGMGGAVVAPLVGGLPRLVRRIGALNVADESLVELPLRVQPYGERSGTEFQKSSAVCDTSTTRCTYTFGSVCG